MENPLASAGMKDEEWESSITYFLNDVPAARKKWYKAVSRHAINHLIDSFDNLSSDEKARWKGKRRA
jgi:hypothetical protein